MNPIPIVTSLPPRMSRVLGEGAEVGEAYGAACLESWRRVGFSPLSINSVKEDLGRGLAGAAEVVRLDRDASTATGRPLVWFSDMLSAACSFGGDQVVLTNADILLDPPFDLAAAVRALRPGTALISKRTDIAAPEQRSGPIYGPGYDFFAMHRADVEAFAARDFGLVFGAPWWDHCLPTVLAASGVRLTAAQEPFAFHLVHQERWAPELWRSLGWSYLERLLAFLEEDGPPQTVALRRQWKSQLQRLALGRRQQARALVSRWLGGRASVASPDEQSRILLGLSDAGMRLIEAHIERRELSIGEAVSQFAEGSL